MGWRNKNKKASHWRKIDDLGGVECRLCPRQCKTKPGQDGFCKVRGNLNGRLFTYNYGRSVACAMESIETEAVYHYRPSARILSMGNVGCMLACDFCQNWETSIVEHLDVMNVQSYTPEEVFRLAKFNEIDIISWTYNDPVVWHEFVLETSRLARAEGIKTLYKSALYINRAPLEELIEEIDIFSISLKSMSADFYRRFTKGRLGPILDAIKLIHKSNRHLEISQLLVPGLNDQIKDIERTIDWVLDNLGPGVPLHFVRFHPDYKYLHVPRTSEEILLLAQELALEKGIRHCYIGNLFKEGVSNTTCKTCGSTLVKRLGLAVEVKGITDNGRCMSCGEPVPIVEPLHEINKEKMRNTRVKGTYHQEIKWTPDMSNIHVILLSSNSKRIGLKVIHDPISKVQYFKLGRGLNRLNVSRLEQTETGVQVLWDSDSAIKVLPVLDRAYYPVLYHNNNEFTDRLNPAAVEMKRTG